MTNFYDLIGLLEKSVDEDKDRAYQRGFEAGKKYVMERLKAYLEEKENEYAD